MAGRSSNTAVRSEVPSGYVLKGPMYPASFAVYTAPRSPVLEAVRERYTIPARRSTPAHPKGARGRQQREALREPQRRRRAIYVFASGIEIMPSQVFETFASRASSSENQCAVTLFSSV
jgi:hypothetical protein